MARRGLAVYGEQVDRMSTLDRERSRIAKREGRGPPAAPGILPPAALGLLSVTQPKGKRTIFSLQSALRTAVMRSQSSRLLVSKSPKCAA